MLRIGIRTTDLAFPVPRGTPKGQLGCRGEQPPNRLGVCLSAAMLEARGCPSQGGRVGGGGGGAGSGVSRTQGYHRPWWH